jgi:hypothetical protein
MKHYYIFRPTKQLCHFSIELIREGYYYLGEFGNEKQALKHLLNLKNNLVKTNSKIAFELGIEEPQEFIPNVQDKYSLIWSFVHHYEMNEQLTFQFHNKQL